MALGPGGKAELLPQRYPARMSRDVVGYSIGMNHFGSAERGVMLLVFLLLQFLIPDFLDIFA